jgi:16S rRNA (guanine527-N7)-methyltransferase
MATTLNKTINEFGLEVSPEVYPKLKQYVQAMWEANQLLNLTRHVTYEKFVSRDLVDTLELSKLIPEGKDVLDIGSGGGVPGMVLAILRPDLNVSLSESVGKKAVALSSIADACDLEIEIYQCRSEQLLEDFSFDFTTARAVGPLVKICTWLIDVWPSVGKLLAVKGPNWKTERNLAAEKSLLKKVQLDVVAEYPTPGTDWSSVILQLQAKKYGSRKKG